MTAKRCFKFAAISAAALLLARPLAKGATAGNMPVLHATVGAIHAERLDHGKDFEGEWKVIVTPDDDARHHHAKEFHDTLVFHGDQFYSEEMKKHGFEQTHYDEDTRRDGPGQFTVKVHSHDEGDIVWQGNHTGDQLSGTLVWTDHDGNVMNYTFQSEQ